MLRTECSGVLQNDSFSTPAIRGKGVFPGGSVRKESACQAGDVGLIPGLGRSPGEGNGNPTQYSYLENPMGIYCGSLVKFLKLNPPLEFNSQSCPHWASSNCQLQLSVFYPGTCPLSGESLLW